MTALLTRVRSRVAIHAHRRIRGLLDGEYASVLTGRSMEFNDLREYVRGDDVKDIEPKASARSGTLLIKRYAAIRKHTVLLVVSTGSGMAAYHDEANPKIDLALLVAGTLGYLAVRHGDLVGGAYGDAAGVHRLPTSGGELALERGLRRIQAAVDPAGAPGDLAALLAHIARSVRRRCIVLVVTDTLRLSPGARSTLRRLVAQHEVLFCTIGEVDPTGVRGAPVVDLATGQPLPGWLADQQLAEEHQRAREAELAELARALDRLGIAHTHLSDDAQAIPAVFSLVERHRRVRRR